MTRDPKKINSYVVLDWETGGLDSRKNPVTEFAGMAIDGTTLNEIIRYDNLIKPYDSKLVYEEAAMKVTGISKEKCEREGIPLRELVKDLCALFEEANIYKSKTAKPICVAHNWDFDRQFLQDVFRRADVDLSKYVSGKEDAWGNFIPHGLDSIDLAKGCWAEVTDNTTKFKLGNCCERAAVDYIDGHRGMNDVLALTDLLRYFLTRLRSGSNEVSVSEGRVTAHRQVFEWK